MSACRRWQGSGQDRIDATSGPLIEVTRRVYPKWHGGQNRLRRPYTARRRYQVDTLIDFPALPGLWCLYGYSVRHDGVSYGSSHPLAVRRSDHVETL